MIAKLLNAAAKLLGKYLSRSCSIRDDAATEYKKHRDTIEKPQTYRSDEAEETLK